MKTYDRAPSVEWCIPGIAGNAIGHRICRYGSVASTNLMALENPEEGAVFVADCQTAGRGQRGNTWSSAPGMGLWFSVCLSGDPKGLPFAAALAVRAALHPRAEVQLKWPNDVLLEGRKICGILAEHRAGWTALGIGLNLAHKPEDFPEELRESAGSLESITGESWDPRDTLCRVLHNLNLQVARLRRGGYGRVRDEWAAACAILGKTIERGAVRGRVVGMEEDGALVVQSETGTHRVDSGAIHILGEAD